MTYAVAFKSLFRFSIHCSLAYILSLVFNKDVFIYYFAAIVAYRIIEHEVVMAKYNKFVNDLGLIPISISLEEENGHSRLQITTPETKEESKTEK